MKDMRICTMCKETKAIEEFSYASYIRKNGTRGRQSHCKPCRSKEGSQWGKENPEKANIKARRWRKKNPKKAREIINNWKKKSRGRFLVALQQSRACAKKSGYLPCNATLQELEAAFTGFCRNPECQVPEIECKRRLCLHHDHKTGVFLGWYCRRCNIIMGLADDNPEVLHGLIVQLKQLQIAI